jgi:hypothetical protein
MAKVAWRRVDYGNKENPGVWDTGNGALRYVHECDAYPGIERVTIETYCGRTSDNKRYYRFSDEPKKTFETLAEANRANNKIRE